MKRAFTLVELSIVLVILGLLVGGVLAGQSLIRSAELRSIITEKDRYVVAINAFKGKYFALPGDLGNAYAYWGNACGTNTDAPSTGCNGNGNGSINYEAAGEIPKAWEHLSRAGLIEGNFDGTGAIVAAPFVALTQTNLPKSKFSSGFWTLTDDALDAGYNLLVSTHRTVPYPGLYLVLGSLPVPSNNYTYTESVTSLKNGEALYIDKKIDDGWALTGNVLGRWEEGECFDAKSDGAIAVDDDGAGRGYISARVDPYAISAVGAESAGNCKLTFVLN